MASLRPACLPACLLFDPCSRRSSNPQNTASTVSLSSMAVPLTRISTVVAGDWYLGISAESQYRRRKGEKNWRTSGTTPSRGRYLLRRRAWRVASSLVRSDVPIILAGISRPCRRGEMPQEIPSEAHTDHMSRSDLWFELIAQYHSLANPFFDRFLP